MKTINSISERVEEIRFDQGITRQEFAERIGCTQEYVRMIENGQRVPKEPYVLAMCYRFGVREKWLKTGSGKKKS